MIPTEAGSTAKINTVYPPGIMETSTHTTLLFGTRGEGEGLNYCAGFIQANHQYHIAAVLITYLHGDFEGMVLCETGRAVFAGKFDRDDRGDLSPFHQLCGFISFSSHRINLQMPIVS